MMTNFTRSATASSRPLSTPLPQLVEMRLSRTITPSIYDAKYKALAVTRQHLALQQQAVSDERAAAARATTETEDARAICSVPLRQVAEQKGGDSTSRAQIIQDRHQVRGGSRHAQEASNPRHLRVRTTLTGRDAGVDRRFEVLVIRPYYRRASRVRSTSLAICFERSSALSNRTSSRSRSTNAIVASCP